MEEHSNPVHLEDLKDHTGLVWSIVLGKFRWVEKDSKYIPRVDLDDLFSEGFLGMTRAFEKFDPNRDVRFSTYARYWIYQYIIKYLNRFSSALTVPFIHNVVKDQDALGLALMSSSLRDYLIVDPSIKEQGKTELCLYLLSTLSNKKRYVVQQRLNGKTLQQIGGILGVSKGRVRQISEEAYTEMRGVLISEGLDVEDVL